MEIKQTLSHCMELCVLRFVNLHCGCTWLGSSGRYGIHKYHGDKPCFRISDDNITDTVLNTLCALHRYKSARKDNSVKSCLEQCSWNCKETGYDYTVSYSKWPEDMLTEGFIINYIGPKSNDIFYKEMYILLQKSYDGTRNKNPQSLTLMEGSKILEEHLRKERNKTKVLEALVDVVNRVVSEIDEKYLNQSSLKEAEKRWVRDSFYRVNIYYKQPVVEVHKQILNTDMAALWSAVGG